MGDSGGDDSPESGNGNPVPCDMAPLVSVPAASRFLSAVLLLATYWKSRLSEAGKTKLLRTSTVFPPLRHAWQVRG